MLKAITNIVLPSNSEKDAFACVVCDHNGAVVSFIDRVVDNSRYLKGIPISSPMKVQ